MGWRFKWVSSYGSDFNYDYHVSFTPEEMAKGKVYYNYEPTQVPERRSCPAPASSTGTAAGDIFHTYSTYARGLDILIGAYNFLDLVPKGRDEDGLASPWHGSAITTGTTPGSEFPDHGRHRGRRAGQIRLIVANQAGAPSSWYLV